MARLDARRSVRRWQRAAARARQRLCLYALEFSCAVDKEVRSRQVRRAALLASFGAWFGVWHASSSLRLRHGKHAPRTCKRRGWLRWVALLRTANRASVLRRRAEAAGRRLCWRWAVRPWAALTSAARHLAEADARATTMHRRRSWLRFVVRLRRAAMLGCSARAIAKLRFSLR